MGWSDWQLHKIIRVWQFTFLSELVSQKGRSDLSAGLKSDTSGWLLRIITWCFLYDAAILSLKCFKNTFGLTFKKLGLLPSGHKTLKINFTSISPPLIKSKLKCVPPSNSPKNNYNISVVPFFFSIKILPYHSILSLLRSHFGFHACLYCCLACMSSLR